MHIRKLELYGFKSFPDRTAFHFDAGVSGVVGPNGCGKSNIVDAVLWCLGEQSPRALRGRSMEDVIFAGSTDRSPMSFAEVSLTFESGDAPFPGEWAHMSEIQIGRRLYRDGHSEYMLNQQRVRLKDIHDLFLDTGVGNRMYCVIEQGRIGEIVNAKPEQRRTLIEEAAGISRYRARRKEAEEKLEETSGNLTRATEVVEDLGKRVRSLERQVEKATRYRRLRTKVRQGEVFLGLARFAALAGDRRALGEQHRVAQTEEENLTLRTRQREADILTARQALEAREADVGRLRDRLAEIEASLREAESARQYQTRETAELQRRLAGLEDQRTRAAAEHADATRRLQEAEAERIALEAKLAAGEQGQGGLSQTHDAAERALSDRRRQLESAKSAVMGRVAELARLRANREANATRRQDWTTRLAALQQRQTDANVDLSSLAEAEQQAAEAERAAGVRLQTARADADAARQALEGAEKGRQARQADVKRATESLARDHRKEQGVRARLESLTQLAERHEGVEDGVKAALGVKGALGTLAEQLDVPVDLERTLATALGESLQAVLVTDEAAALAARAAARGRVVIVSLDGAVAPTQGFAARIAGTALGKAALGVLLGRCDEAPDLSAALAAHRASGRPCVSGCGAFVGPHGEVITGVAGGAGAALLARRREIASLQAEVAKLAEEVGAREAELAAAQALLDTTSLEIDAARGRLEQTRVALSEAELALRDAGHSHREKAREHSRVRDQARQLSKEEADLLASIATCERQESELAQGIGVAETAQIAAEEALKAHQVALPNEEAAATRARDALAQARSDLAALRERLLGVRRAEGGARAAQASAERQLQGADAEATTARERVAVLSEDQARTVALLATLGADQATLKASLDAERERVRTDRAALSDADAKIRDLRERREAATALRLDLDRQINALREECNRIREQLDDRYQVSVPGLLDRMERDGHVTVAVDDAARGPVIEGEPERWAGIEPVEDLRITAAHLEDAELIQTWVAELGRARDKLSGLGDVNLVAVEEYIEVAGEHRTLEAQRADLEESVKAIRQTIARLNRTCRERFRETFDRVDGYFRELYPQLVGGGAARLVLTNEEDLLETGVEIYVQPPGKRLVHLSLLSGGETAMVAIALLFSLFREKPSPFCLLDEVDAPLDEGNGARFNGLLKEMALNSQFIVITHNKKTMECMDTLYGVTMPAPGVSRLVTVRLD